MKTKKRDLLNRYIPLWSIAPLVTIMAVNCLIYWGSSALTAGRYHYDFTMAFDREVPLLPVFCVVLYSGISILGGGVFAGGKAW